MPKDKLTDEEKAAYEDFLAHGGIPVVIPPTPMVEEPDWMYDLEEILGWGEPVDDVDPARPYEPRFESEQDWRKSWR